MNEQQVQSFWQANPCGDNLLSLKDYSAVERFFDEYDRFKYNLEPHIPSCLDRLELDGLSVLEVGLGQGAESEQLIRRGANWSGLDLTEEAVKRVKTRLDLRGLSYSAVKQGSITRAPYPDNSFDLVFSHGVLHHVPDIEAAQAEIARMLRPKGRLVVMLYAKYSLNYLLSISVLRRLGLIGLKFIGSSSNPVYQEHLANAERVGLFNYLRMQNFIHSNTDGPLNPYSEVYSVKKVKQNFPLFAVERSYKRFMHAPPLRVGRLPFENVLGWHLWVEMRKL